MRNRQKRKKSQKPTRKVFPKSKKLRLVREALDKLDKNKINLDLITECPVFRPNSKQFEHPMNYIKSIYPEVINYGICKIIPPPDWSSSDPDRFFSCRKTFTTKKQSIHKLQLGAGYKDGDNYTTKSFKKMADDFYSSFKAENEMENVSQLERCYWEMVYNYTCLDVEYGSDTSSSNFTTGFDPSKKSSWDLNKLPEAEGSLLREVGERVSGVTEPWVYFGMLFSTFCWHHEDDSMCSISYNHVGHPKIWYGVPGGDDERLEGVFRNLLPDLFRREPDLMTKLATMLHPSLLIANSVNIVRAQQNAGEFILTFPNAYHAGFNAGFNIAEAVNFAPEFWLKSGLKSVSKYAELKREPVLSITRLAVMASRRLLNSECNGNVNDVRMLNDALRIIARSEERLMRRRAVTKVLSKRPLRKVEEARGSGQVAICSVCKRKCFLSYLRCATHKKKRGCLAHAEVFCKCADSLKNSRELCVAMTYEDIESLSTDLENKFCL